MTSIKALLLCGAYKKKRTATAILFLHYLVEVTGVIITLHVPFYLFTNTLANSVFTLF